jgi:histidine triad (HIT) family protein
MASVFSKIISGEIPCHKVAETNDYLAFLDIQPLAPGHTLVIPKKEVDYIFDMDDESLMGLHLFSKYVAQAIKKVVPCTKIGVSVIGLEVPHAHIHLIPIDRVTDMDFGKSRRSWSEEELSEMAKRIAEALV